jgi:hypothetical protein
MRTLRRMADDDRLVEVIGAHLRWLRSQQAKHDEAASEALRQMDEPGADYTTLRGHATSEGLAGMIFKQAADDLDNRLPDEVRSFISML